MRNGRKLGCQEACLKYASREGSLSDIDTFMKYGACDVERACIAAAKSGQLEATLKLISVGAPITEDVLVASSFGGNEKLVTEIESRVASPVSEAANAAFLVGAVSSGSLPLVKKALMYASPQVGISWFINPNKRGFKKIVKELDEVVDLTLTLIACARSASVKKFESIVKMILKERSTRSKEVTPCIYKEAYIQAVYGNNMPLMNRLKKRVTLDEDDSIRVVNAAAYSPCMSVLSELSHVVNEDVVNMAALRGNDEVVSKFVHLASPVTQGYAAYSGNDKVLDVLCDSHDIRYDMIALGAIRAGNMFMVVDSVCMLSLTQEFLTMFLSHGLRSKSGQAREFARGLAEDNASDYQMCLNMAHSTSVDNMFPLMKGFVELG